MDTQKDAADSFWQQALLSLNQAEIDAFRVWIDIDKPKSLGTSLVTENMKKLRAAFNRLAPKEKSLPQLEFPKMAVLTVNLMLRPLRSPNIVWRALRVAGIEDFHFHDLRHTFASYFAMKGGDLYTLAKILGHASPKMTLDNYSHLSPEFIHEQRRVMDAPAYAART